MNPRLRKLIGMFGVLAFLLFYVGLIVKLSDYVPDHGLLQLAFYALAGICWGIPLFPLISWMNRGR
jgi:hypothetical protein